MLRVYLDNNVASAITQRDGASIELVALDQLREWNQSGKIVLGSSRHTLREMERAPARYQDSLRAGLADVEVSANDHRVLGSFTQMDQFGGCVCNPMVSDVIDEPLYADLIAFGLDADDAKHLMYATQNDFDYFVTNDSDFLRRRSSIETRCSPIRVRKPSEMVSEFSAST